MSDEVIFSQISLFLTQIENRRFDEGSLRILESVLVSKDVSSFIQVRSSLIEFMRSESLTVFREKVGESVDQKLSVLDFFVRSFALIGDVESCLATRYEALTLRELKSSTYQWLRVSHTEWVKFAKQSFENGFHAIARKACENALLSLKRDDTTDPSSKEFLKNLEVAEQIRRLKDCAVTSASSHSVHAQAAMYLRTKEIRNHKAQPLLIKGSECMGSTLFRDGIKKRNQRMLQELRNKRSTIESHVVHF